MLRMARIGALLFAMVSLAPGCGMPWLRLWDAVVDHALPEGRENGMPWLRAGSPVTYTTSQPYLYTAKQPYPTYSLVTVPLDWDAAVPRG